MSIYYKAHVSLAIRNDDDDSVGEKCCIAMLAIDSRGPSTVPGDCVSLLSFIEPEGMECATAGCLLRAGQTLIELSKLMEVE